METIYLCIVIFLLCLAVFDLFVGVSNDAVNFLQSAIGARVATFRTVLIIASSGILLGVIMSSGMMDVARHGILVPTHYSFHEVMTVFLAVMVTDVIVLDVFNTLGMPTSTTVSLVFELLGGTVMLATLKVWSDGSLELSSLVNSSESLKVIVSIFLSVAIAFIVGMVVMWISRVIFTFNYKRHSRYSIAIFGGIAFTALSYFIFIKGMGKSPYISEHLRNYIDENTNMLLVYTFIISTVVMEVLHLLKVNIVVDKSISKSIYETCCVLNRTRSLFLYLSLKNSYLWYILLAIEENAAITDTVNSNYFHHSCALVVLAICTHSYFV